MSNLKGLRESLSITQKQLASEIGHTASSVGHYESGRRKPDIPTCHLIVSALSKHGTKVTIEDIFPNPESLTSAAEGQP
ncbi:helix-turn-helix transcriptional regulator [Erwinia rhapontici]|uniref:helix-turn-helix transcriptional regulator n=1 Tax=Erwinia rhapontici TaxID=55212 RepID=UPI001061D6C2|nr:helix-turn-helix transcriptional regulator [Erwinia rhapontici]TDT01659.1 putative transcriptional regulator [Erwinia rhapontici]